MDVKWDKYSSHWLEVLKDLKETNFLSDVTLVCEDNSRFEAHKLVLSACSPVLRSIMELAPLCRGTVSSTSMVLLTVPGSDHFQTGMSRGFK